MKSLHMHSLSKITPYIQNLPKKPLTAVVGTVDAGRKLQGGSLATFLVAPHLITELNFDCATISLDMLQMKLDW
jgi:hypothetical protein